jgi:hypothetical protein
MKKLVCLCSMFIALNAFSDTSRMLPMLICKIADNAHEEVQEDSGFTLFSDISGLRISPTGFPEGKEVSSVLAFVNETGAIKLISGLGLTANFHDVGPQFKAEVKHRLAPDYVITSSVEFRIINKKGGHESKRSYMAELVSTSLNFGEVSSRVQRYKCFDPGSSL